jgi:hypothetical protein
MALPDAIERYIASAFAGHQRLHNEKDLRVYAQHVKARAFPELHAPLEFVFLRSRRRHCEQFLHGDGGLIILDQGLTALLAMQDALLTARGYDPDHGLVVMHVPFAEAFRHEDAVEHSLLCVARCLEQRNLLADLCRSTFSQPGHSRLGVVVLLHEIAHFAIDTRQPFAEWIIERVRRGLDDHCQVTEQTGDRLRAGDRIADIDLSVAESPAEDRAVMARQMADHVRHIRSNDEVVRETSCDVLASLGLLALLVGYDTLNGDRPVVHGVTPRQVGDCLLQGLNASRALMAQAFLRQTVENIASKSDPSQLVPPFAQITARYNIATNIVLGLFNGIADEWRFEQRAAPGESGQDIEPTELFARGVQVLAHRSIERLMKPIETIGLLHRDAEAMATELAHRKSALFQDRHPSRFELAAVRDRLLDLIPL